MNKKEEDYKNALEYESYLGKKVRILLFNNYTYTGIIVDVRENSIKIKDKYGSLVELSPKAIMILTEVF